MGSVDKGLVELAGEPMVAHVIERLAPQVGELLINANQNADRYAAFGYRGHRRRDRRLRRPARRACTRASRARRRRLVVTVPCDSPFLPRDLVARLRAALDARGAELAVARTVRPAAPGVRAGAPRRAAASRRVPRRRRPQDRRVVCGAANRRSPFDDEADAFRNINTAAELRRECRPCALHVRRLPEDAARAVVRRRLRSELDAGRSRRAS